MWLVVVDYDDYDDDKIPASQNVSPPPCLALVKKYNGSTDTSTDSTIAQKIQLQKRTGVKKRLD